MSDAGPISASPSILLDEAEARVLGSLVEKEITTPEYYPLSLNALTNACNQKTNRDPVMELDEQSVRQALDGLEQQELARAVNSPESRVTKYEHRLQEVFNFTRAETAVICVLLLRGPQTPGELRGRTERLYHFPHLDDVQATLQRLMQREPPLVKVLPRQPGTKEVRYAHLLSGDVQTTAMDSETRAPSIGSETEERIARLEQQVSELQKEVAELKQELSNFRQQFES
jgi:uncharacterized protein YceH (UPF0502 family)